MSSKLAEYSYLLSELASRRFSSIRSVSSDDGTLLLDTKALSTRLMAENCTLLVLLLLLELVPERPEVISSDPRDLDDEDDDNDDDDEASEDRSTWWVGT